MSASIEAGIKALTTAIRVRPRIPFERWAEENIRDADGVFRFRPYQIVPAASIFDPAIYSVSLRQYSGAGKTYLFAAAMAYAVAQLKLNIATQFPTAKQSEDWLRRKLKPFLVNTSATDSIKTVRDVAGGIYWQNGASIEVSGANSASVTRTIEAHWTNSEEIDAYIQDASDEGDKVKVFEKRTRGRGLQIHTRSAYPSVKGHSQIDAAFDNSDRCNWFMDCPRCGVSRYWHPREIVWPDDRPEKAEVECPECSGLFSDAERRESCLSSGHWKNRDGETVGVNDPPPLKYGSNRGFHLNCMAHVGAYDESRTSYLHEIAAEWEAVEDAPNPEKARRAVVNTMWAESYSLAFEEKARTPALLRQREDYDPAVMLPEEVIALTWGGDVNKRFLSAVIMGWGLNGESWAIDYADLQGHVDNPETWKRLERFVFQSFRHPFGIEISCLKGCLDTRYQKSIARKWVSNYTGRGVVAVTGSNQLGVPIIDRASRDKESRITVQSIGTHEAKDLLNQRLQLRPPEDGEEYPENFKHYPRTNAFGASYFRGLTEAEESFYKRAPRDGELYPFYQKTEECYNGNLRNEPLDCEVYALGALKLLNINLAGHREVLKARASNPATSKQPRRKIPRRNSFIGKLSS